MPTLNTARDSARSHPVSNAYQVLEEHLQAGRLDPAEAMARHLLESNPDDPNAHVAWARIAALRGNVDEGIKRLERLLAQQPKFPSGLAWLAVMWGDKGDAERALLLARRAVSLGARVAQTDVMLGDDALTRGALDEALPYFDRAVAQNTRFAAGWVGRGRVHRAQGNLAEAEDAFARAVEAAPLRLDAWVNLVEVELEGGADDAAFDNLALALRAHPGHPKLLAIKHAAEQKKLEGDPLEGALADVRRLVTVGDVEGAQHALARISAQVGHDDRIVIVEVEIAAITGKGDLPGLINAANRIVRDRPTAWEPRAALGRILLRQSPLQNVRMGLAQCEEAWRTSGEHPRAGLFLFEAYAAAGKRAHALALGQKLAQGDSAEATLVRQLLGEVPSPEPFQPFFRGPAVDKPEVTAPGLAPATGDDDKK